jgi:type IV secretion system protein VirB9
MKSLNKSAAILLATSFLFPAPSEAKHVQRRVKSSPTLPVTTADPGLSAKTVQYGAKDVIRLNTKVRFTTMIILPENEQILDFTCGDKELWVVNGNQNFAYVKPAKEGATTNLNLTTASGNIYSFVLVEISNIPNTQPDLKVFVEPKDPSMITAASQSPRFVSSIDLENSRKQIEDIQKEKRRLQDDLDAQANRKANEILSQMQFTYRFNSKKKPFHIKAIWHDSKFTYIQGQPEETPTLYEVRDGKPNLVNFEYKDGVYVAEKVIDRGYLAIGKSRLLFVRHE